MKTVFEEAALEIGVEVAVPEERGEVGRLDARGCLGALGVLVDGGVIPALDRGVIAGIAEA